MKILKVQTHEITPVILPKTITLELSAEEFLTILRGMGHVNGNQVKHPIGTSCGMVTEPHHHRTPASVPKVCEDLEAISQTVLLDK